MDDYRISLLEEKLGYHFCDPSIIEEALCHSSYVNENPKKGVKNNERLEFLGDAVLDLVVGHILMEHFRGSPEGDLTRMRAALVNERQLAEMSRSLGIGDCLLLGKGELFSGGRQKDSILAGALEAVIAAVYLDGGYERAFRVVLSLVAPLLPGGAKEAGAFDHKSCLQELMQSMGNGIPLYSLVSETGPDHSKSFTVRLEAGGISVEGTGKSKKTAEQVAAKKALEILAKRG